MRSLGAVVAACSRVGIDGVWHRHVAARHTASALTGRRGSGRWSTRDGFPVLYLGRPINSIIVEAYRHLVDPVEDERILAHLEPRAVVSCTVAVTNLLDLREASTRMKVNLPLRVLRSATFDRDAYSRCQSVAQAAYQVGLHGMVTPAATNLGDTLALFTDTLPMDEHPVRSASDVVWESLPADPRITARRHLRGVTAHR